MSDILKRTIYIGRGNDGFIRVSDWAMVITSIGHCYEPRTDNRGQGVVDFDWQDPQNRIDQIDAFNPSGPTWGDGTIGGDLTPVLGY